MFDALFTYFTTNPMFSGGVGLAAMGGVMYFLRSLPGQIVNFVKTQFVTDLTIYSEDSLFDVMSGWMGRNMMKHSRNLKLEERWEYTENGGGSDDEPANADGEKRERKIDFGPGTGWHFLKHGTHHYVVHRYADEKAGQSWGNSRRENLCFYVLGRLSGREKLKSLIDSAVAELVKDNKRIPILMWDYNSFAVMDRRLPRPLDTIYVNDEIKNFLLADLKNFIASRETYMRQGVPYRRGYFFEGPPGTGKSSLVFALAASLKRPIYVINPSSMTSDESLYSAFARVPENGIILMEDIDTNLVTGARKAAPKKPSRSENPLAPPSRDGAKGDGITLSGLLNAIDGVWAKEGRILFITSNHPDKLDPALLRPGRIDVRRHIGLLGPAEVVKMYRAFYPDVDDDTILAEVKTPISGAELQGLLLDKRALPAAA